MTVKPPGWVFVDGVTVPPQSPILKQVTEDTISTHLEGEHCDFVSREEFFEFYEVKNFDHSDDAFLGIWFCTKCYLDPSEKPPDFEMCRCCLENYYFPFPPHLTKVWHCPGCKLLQKGEYPVHRQCNQCGKDEEITMTILQEHF